MSSDDSAANTGSSGDSTGDTDGSGDSTGDTNGFGDSASDNTVTGIQVGEYAGGGDVAETTLNVTGEVTVEKTQEGADGAAGIDVELTGDNTIDKSVTVNTGDVTVKDTSGGTGYSGVQGVNYPKNSGGQSSADQETASTTVTVNTGNVTVSSNSEYGITTGINIGQGSTDVKVNVEGDVTVTGSTATGVEVSDQMDGVAEVSISGDVKVSGKGAAEGEGIAYGVLTGSTGMSYIDDDHAVITIGGDLSAEGGSAFGIGLREIPSQRGTVKVGGNITAAAEAEDGTAAAIQAQTNGVTTILVGGNASATGNDSTGIELKYFYVNDEIRKKETEHPGRIEVLGTVSGGTGDIVLSLNDKENAAAPAETVKADLEAQIPTIVTHKLENNSIVVKADSNNQETMEAAAGILKDRILYTVNYTAKVSNENGQEDSSLGAIEITKYDGLQLDQEKLQTTGETVYVARAGEVIRINIKATDKTTTEDKKLVENNKTTTWTETTSYEIDLDQLDGNVSGGKDYVLKAEKKENGEVIYTLEVKQGGGVDIDVNSIIRAIVTRSNEKTVTNSSSDSSDSSSGSSSSSGSDSSSSSSGSDSSSSSSGSDSSSGSSSSDSSGSSFYTPASVYYIGDGGGTWLYADPQENPGENSNAYYYDYNEDLYQSAADVAGTWKYSENQGYYQIDEAEGSGENPTTTDSGNTGNSGKAGNANKAGRTWWKWQNKNNNKNGAIEKAGWKKLRWGDYLDWYFFDNDRLMRAGFINWEGNRYFLNPISNGYRGRMLTGYQKINGLEYYFEEKEGPLQGRMYRNENVPDKRFAGPDGVIR